MTLGRWVTLASAVAVALALIAATVPRAPETAARRVDRIASELRCPVCQALSVKDSPSETARAIREVIAQRVAEGRSDEEIRDEFRRSYGDWILLAPPLVAPGGIMWLLPLALVAAGALVARRLFGAGPPAPEAAPDPGALALLRTRVAEEEVDA